MSGRTSYIFIPHLHALQPGSLSFVEQKEQEAIARATQAYREMGLNPWAVPGFSQNIHNICDTLDHEMAVTRLVHRTFKRSNMRMLTPLPARTQTISILGAYLHDRGKLPLDQNVLHQNGKLSAKDREHIEEHSEIGYALLLAKDIAFLNGTLDKINKQNNWTYKHLRADDADAVKQVALAIRHHHEAFNGAGYPMGLSGKDIPLPARLIAVADNYDALRAKRAYKPAQLHSTVIPHLWRKATTGHLDPSCWDAIRVAITPSLHEGTAHPQRQSGPSVKRGQHRQHAPTQHVRGAMLTLE